MSGISSSLSREKEGPKRVLSKHLELQDKILEPSNCKYLKNKIKKEEEEL